MFNKKIIVKTNDKIKGILFNILLIFTIGFIYIYADSFIKEDYITIKKLNFALLFSATNSLPYLCYLLFKKFKE